MRRFWFGTVGLAGIGMLVAGCVLFTGSTNGYTQVDAGEDAGGACFSTADCNDGQAGPAEGGQVCCAGINVEGPPTTCHSDCTGLGEIGRVCKTSAECGGASCIQQECEILGLSLVFYGCGVGPACAAVDAGTADAAQ